MKAKDFIDELLCGRPVASGEAAICTACNETLHEGRDVTVYAVAERNNSAFQVTRIYCSSCELRTIKSGVPDRQGALLRARLATTTLDQEVSLTLAEPTLVDWSDAEYDHC